MESIPPARNAKQCLFVELITDPFPLCPPPISSTTAVAPPESLLDIAISCVSTQLNM